MTDDHICGERPCIMGKYNGAYFRCSRCSNKVYCDCLEKRKEVVQLLNALKNLNPYSTPTTIQLKIKAIFSNESVFEFICNKCKNEENPYEIIARIKTESKKKINEREMEKNMLKEKIRETEALNNDLLEKIDMLETKNKHESMQTDEININELEKNTMETENEAGLNERERGIIKIHNTLLSKIKA